MGSRRLHCHRDHRSHRGRDFAHRGRNRAAGYSRPASLPVVHAVRGHPGSCGNAEPEPNRNRLAKPHRCGAIDACAVVLRDGDGVRRSVSDLGADANADRPRHSDAVQCGARQLFATPASAHGSADPDTGPDSHTGESRGTGADAGVPRGAPTNAGPVRATSAWQPVTSNRRGG